MYDPHKPFDARKEGSKKQNEAWIAAGVPAELEERHTRQVEQNAVTFTCSRYDAGCKRRAVMLIKLIGYAAHIPVQR